MASVTTRRGGGGGQNGASLSSRRMIIENEMVPNDEENPISSRNHNNILMMDKGEEEEDGNGEDEDRSLLLELSSPNNNNNNNNNSMSFVEEDDLGRKGIPFESERESLKVRHWKESPFAVGLVEVTWEDELTRGQKNYASSASSSSDCCNDETDPTCGCLSISGLICGKYMGAGRLGNMVILRESWVDDNNNNDDSRRRQLDLIVGPYWPMMLFVTYPLIFAVSGLTIWISIRHQHPLVILLWSLMTFSLIYSLFSVAFRDPGILLRHSQPPPSSSHNQNNHNTSYPSRRGTAEWRWNDDAQTYRPRTAIYDPDCAVVIEGFDHTCPWTGTAIGHKNMGSFQLFVGLVFFMLLWDVVLMMSSTLVDKRTH